MRVLLVEDDSKIGKFIQQGLREEGFVVNWARDGEAGLEAALHEGSDLVILDLMLPKKDGMTVCREIRRNAIKTPILMLTAKATVESRVAGLDCGADDYLTKPFAFSELLARIRALSRRSAGEATPVLEGGGVRLDLVAHKASFEGKDIELTGREFSLLHLFLRRKGHILSRTIIAESVWGYDFQSGTNVIDVYVNYLRKKLRQITGRDLVKTVRNRGYTFDDSDASED